MTTTAEAMQVMLVVQGCHPRTAPRADDPDAIRAIATIWAELFSTYRLEVADLVAGVKKRALTQADAPEPADIISVAREIRRERDARTGPTAEYEAVCESKSADTRTLREITGRAGVRAIGRDLDAG
jgi:hypothetical protein